MTRLFHVSDLHFGTEDRAALAWFAGVVEAERPDAVVVTGDLTAFARRHEFIAAARWLRALAAPVSVEPGNHDLSWNPVRRLIAPYARYERLERAVERPLTLPGVALVPLRSTARLQLRRNWSLGRISDPSLALTLARLRAQPDGMKTLVACHHPLIDMGTLTPGRTRGGAAALAALAAAGADAVLSGHTHDPFDRPVEIGGRIVRLIGAGTLSERIRATPPSFNAITVGETVEVAVRVMS